MSNSILIWSLFNVFILLLLVIDLGVFHRKSHTISGKEALRLSLFWIALALGFNLFIYFTEGSEAALNFFTGYLIEKALSVDNIFVFLVIFRYFQVPQSYQHKVLFWGITGALVMRACMIFAGIELIKHFHWLIYLFGAFLIYTGVKLATHKEVDIDPDKNLLLRLFKRFLPVTEKYEGDRFFVKRNSDYFVTPLFVVLLFIETTDLIFALDSIPAILAITTDPFIVYSSNVFAILGLRALFFGLSSMIGLFKNLHYGLAFILSFVGVKMLIEPFYKIPITITLPVIAAALILSCLSSKSNTNDNHV